MSDSIGFLDALTDPRVTALLGMAQGFGQAAMPTRMPTPFGAVLGMGAGGALSGAGTGMALQKAGIQNQQAKIALDWYRQQYGNGSPFGAPSSGATTSQGDDQNSRYLVPPRTLAGMIPMLVGSGNERAVPAVVGLIQHYAGAPGNAMAPNGTAFQTPGGSADPRTVFAQSRAEAGGKVEPAIAQAAGTKAVEAPYTPPVKMTRPVLDANGQPVLDANGQPTYREEYVPTPAGGWNSSTGAAPTIAADPFPVWAKQIQAHENGTGNPGARNPNSTAAGNGQFVDGTWPTVLRATRPDIAAGKSDAELMPLKAIPDLADSATTQYGRMNGAALAQAGVPVNGATIAMAHGLGARGAIALLQKTDNTPVAAFMPKGAIDANPYLQNGATVGSVKQFYAQRMGAPGVGGGSGPVGIQGAPSLTPQQEANLKVDTAKRMPFDLRAGGMHIEPDTGNETKNPELREIQLPNGQKAWVHINPASPMAPPGTPGVAAPVNTGAGVPAVAALPPQQQKARDAAVHDFQTKDQDSYQAAQNTQAWLNQIDHASDVLNKSGPAYMTGPFMPQRLALMSGANDIARTLGLPPSLQFNPNAIASWEEMKKATTTAGFELSSHYEGHARQAAATIMNATSAVPAQTNSPTGLKLVSSGIREGAQSAMDAHEYKQQVYNATQGAGLENAETDFYRAHPAQQYANRAISNVQPFSVKSPEEMARYLPGTFVTIPKISPTTGKPMIVQVPPRQEQIGGQAVTIGIPAYMAQSQQAPANAP